MERSVKKAERWQGLAEILNRLTGLSVARIDQGYFQHRSEILCVEIRKHYQRYPVYYSQNHTQTLRSNTNPKADDSKFLLAV